MAELGLGPPLPSMRERRKGAEGGGGGEYGEGAPEAQQCFASRNNEQLENNGYRQSLGLFIAATVSPRQQELEVCRVSTAPTGPGLEGR